MSNIVDIRVWDMTVYITTNDYEFMYTPAKYLLKPEFIKSDDNWVGGLQCNFSDDNDEYHELEVLLIDRAKELLKQYGVE